MEPILQSETIINQAISEIKIKAQSFSEIDLWQRALLTDVSTRFCSTTQSEVQKKVGVWQWHNIFPCPIASDLNIAASGSLSFAIDVGEETVFFSVWIQFGEIRIGVRVPSKLIELGTSFSKLGVKVEKISFVFDGTPCSRHTEGKDSHFFDWIFRESFANLELMIRSMDNDLVRKVIADRISGILTHIYMSITNMLMEKHGDKASINRLFAAKETLCRIMIGVTDEVDAFKIWITEKGGIIISVIPQDDRILYVIEKPVSLVISKGFVRDMDGGQFNIVSLDPV